MQFGRMAIAAGAIAIAGLRDIGMVRAAPRPMSRQELNDDPFKRLADAMEPQPKMRIADRMALAAAAAKRERKNAKRLACRR